MKSSSCLSHFSAGKCFALKVPGKENCQVKKIYWMHFQKESLIWHLLSGYQKNNFSHSYIKKHKGKNTHSVLKYFYAIFFYSIIFSFIIIVYVSLFWCLPVPHLQMQNLLVFSLSGALFPQATQYRGSTQYFAQDYPLSGNSPHILAFRN